MTKGSKERDKKEYSQTKSCLIMKYLIWHLTWRFVYHVLIQVEPHRYLHIQLYMIFERRSGWVRHWDETLIYPPVIRHCAPREGGSLAYSTIDCVLSSSHTALLFLGAWGTSEQVRGGKKASKHK